MQLDGTPIIRQKKKCKQKYNKFPTKSVLKSEFKGSAKYTGALNTDGGPKTTLLLIFVVPNPVWCPVAYLAHSMDPVSSPTPPAHIPDHQDFWTTRR